MPGKHIIGTSGYVNPRIAEPTNIVMMTMEGAFRVPFRISDADVHASWGVIWDRMGEGWTVSRSGRDLTLIYTSTTMVQTTQ